VQVIVAAAVALLFTGQTLRSRFRLDPARRALLSSAAFDGVIERSGKDWRVRTETVDLERADLACVLVAEIPFWMHAARAGIASTGLQVSSGDHALVGRLREEAPAWALYRSPDDSARPTLRRAAAWDRFMPYVYFALAMASLAWWAS
jgi:hypothetical protein